MFLLSNVGLIQPSTPIPSLIHTPPPPSQWPLPHSPSHSAKSILLVIVFSLCEAYRRLLAGLASPGWTTDAAVLSPAQLAAFPLQAFVDHNRKVTASAVHEARQGAKQAEDRVVELTSLREK